MAEEHTGHLLERQDNKRRGQNQNWTANHGQHTKRKTTSLAWTCFPYGPPAHTTASTVYWQVPGYKRAPGRPRANWRSTSTKTYKRWGSPGRKQRCQLLTDTDGVGVWPNVSSWMRDESSQVKSILKISWQLKV